MSRLERFQRRKELLRTHRHENVAENVIFSSSVEGESNKADFVRSSVFAAFEESQQAVWADLQPREITFDDAERLLGKLRQEWKQAKLDGCIEQARQTVINSIVGPLGIGHIVAAYDKDGGNVDTVHNTRQGVYASEEERIRYEQRGEYDSYQYHADSEYIAINRKLSAQKKNGTLTDNYTGQKIAPNGNTDLDHVVSAHEIQNDPGRVLAEMDGASLANTESNLRMTNSSINRSKSNKSVDDFLERQEIKGPERTERITSLRNQSDLSQNERKELAKLEQLDAVDAERMKTADTAARKNINSEINKSYYKSSKFAKNLAITGAMEAGKMGMQQAMGLLLMDLFEALLFEIKDAYRHGITAGTNTESVMGALMQRCKRVAGTVIEDWKAVVTAFRDGAISGLLSNIVTSVINMFTKTAKNLVRIIREGIFMLFRAIKLLIFRPEGMTLAQAADAAVKLLATGAITLGGIALDQYLNDALRPGLFAIPVLAPFFPTFIAVLSGGITGIVIALAAYALDKMDIFGVDDKKRHVFICQKLCVMSEESDKNIWAMYREVTAPLY